MTKLKLKTMAIILCIIMIMSVTIISSSAIHAEYIPIQSGKYYIVNSNGEAIDQSGALTSYGFWGSTNVMLVEYNYNTGCYTIRANSYLTNKQYEMYMRPGSGYSGQPNRIYPHPYTSLYQAGNEVFWIVEVVDETNNIYEFYNYADYKILSFNSTQKYAYTSYPDISVQWQLIPA